MIPDHWYMTADLGVEWRIVQYTHSVLAPVWFGSIKSQENRQTNESFVDDRLLAGEDGQSAR
ncbi:MAG: hypothetical protein AAGD07_03205 [Planctomycetota bacterium]